ncbi:FlgO family outer membrane protein [Pyxidicoccus trucidator]|uniref:FlgO family outer membrane protein n=1 Tax=Pyxidicoccus trucidator TaxID=2709662 RepID=UPI0013DCE278|nr:FlgO family outer membrane protein [Pyxidicoccus trucidator]
MSTVLALLLASLAAAAPPAPPQGPVAVMPFRNLNSEPELDWLGRGMAETLVSDLRASGRLRVVEREQLAPLLAELTSREQGELSESTAARVGRMVGARTLVLGSFQRSGRQVRINARFISVETGEVLGTAKATGALDRIFTLQDEVVARLLGLPLPAAAKRPSGPAAVRAYERYGRALASTSDDERARLLREALAESPGFTYAQEELTRLERRLAEYARHAQPLLDSRDAEQRAVLEDLSRPAAERSAAALALLDAYNSQGRWRSLARHAERIFQLDLPRHEGRLPAEEAGWAWVRSLGTLGSHARQIEAGEAFLRRFPESPLAQPVDTLVRGTAAMVATEERARRDMWDSLKKLEEEVERKRVRLEGRGEPTTRLRWELARRHCAEPAMGQFHDVSVVTCRAFLDAWSPGTTPAERTVVRDAWTAEILALVRLRRHAEARERLAAFRAADPEGERESLARATILRIPAGAEE